jgi:cytochrome c peroxidase
MTRLRPLFALALGLVAAACTSYGPAGSPAPPESFRDRPAIPQPSANPSTAARVALGKALFHDPNLSADRTMSCATCHQPERAFTDGTPTARGRGNRPLTHNTPGLHNIGLATSLFWDGRSPSLEDQALRPIVDPQEMALAPAELMPRIKAQPHYAALFAAAFPGEAPGASAVARALAAYQRTLVSGEASVDRFLAGDRSAMTAEAQRGFALFAGHARCATCHAGWAFSDWQRHDIGRPDTANRKVRTPSLREVGRTAPYMHDGRFPTLEAVVDHYSDGAVRRLGAAPTVRLTATEKAELVDFLRSLDSDA